MTRGVDPRFPASAVPSITGLRVSPNSPVDLVNISCSGMLVEGTMRFAPATRVVIMVEGSFAPQRIEGAVVRCQVSSITRGTVRYQFAIEFDERLGKGAIGADQESGRYSGVAEAPPAPDVMTPPRTRPAVNRW